MTDTENTTELVAQFVDDNVPAKVRTVAYFVLLVCAAVVLLVQGLAPIWLEPALADKAVASAGVVTAVLGLIAGGLGVAYRPTR